MNKPSTLSAALASLAARIGISAAVAEAVVDEPIKVSTKHPAKSGSNAKTEALPVTKRRKLDILAMSHFNLHTPERQADETQAQYRARLAASRAHVRLITCKGMSGGGNTRADLRANTRMRLRAEGKKRASLNREIQRVFRKPMEAALINATA